MRLRIIVATVSLLMLGGFAAYFADDLKRLWPYYRAERKLDDARAKLPFVSLTARLPSGKPTSPSKPLSAKAAKQWEEIEVSFSHGDRASMLKALHERTRNVFVDTPGAGKRRMLETPEEILMDTDYSDPQHRRQGGEPAYFPISPGETVIPIQPDPELRDLHRMGVLRFLSPRSFGYVKDRDHVAGFKPHAFRYAPYVPKSKNLRLDHVQLVGILAHDRPVVYLTDHLPSMEQIRHVKTRALDLFEEAGLPILQEGEDLYIVSKDDTLRMLGALRATKTCQKCHGAEIGDLLGAFSYTLRMARKEGKMPD